MSIRPAQKSVLVGVLTGDTLQAHNNDVRLFGRPRGDLSLQELRESVGLVSARVHAQFQHQHQTALRVVCSGMHAVVGPCPPCSAAQHARARAWAACFGAEPLLARPFSALSQGQQRLVLVLRALVSSGPDSGGSGLPRLLLLDEPFHGLDVATRARIRAALAELTEHTTVLLVSHHADDAPPFAHKRLALPC